MLTSVPVSTTVAAKPAASTASTPGVTHARVAMWPSPFSASTWPSAGSTSQNTMPPSTEVSSQVIRAHDVLHDVANSTPSTGPIMKVISSATESIDSAVLRMPSGVTCSSACRTIVNDGMVNSPPTAASASSGQ